ncbi:DNA-directed RNA polymerase III subunit RPC7 [Bagarius yarrelli]|uniref:DNA-directed RNA polymerase III subunit RPC7 n=1 Tax=Bagarius yarrelli TaxID=175774 RepID=A0A556U5A2_BAGYA|nr:DNA-directed RNA polymerase III subunit RPC7 [Bagarius yarrelli]
MEFKPVPLKAGEDDDYMLALKQEIRGRMKSLPFNIKPNTGRSDWNRVPKELMPQKKRIKRKTSKYTDKYTFTVLAFPVKIKNGPLFTDTKKSRKISSKDQEAVLSKLDELEKKGDKSDDENEREKEEKKGNEEGEEEVEADEYDEEELEEENDYIDTYFEDGDDFGAGSDDNMDEATY